MKKRSSSLLLAALMLLVTACTDKKVHDEFRHVPSSGWQRGAILPFAVDSLPQTGTYDLSLMLRTNNAFPFKNTTLIIDELVRPSNTHYVDTIVCQLFDDKGQTLGKGVNSYQYEFAINSRKLSQGDTLLIKIRHDMRRDILPGITEVGVAVVRE